MVILDQASAHFLGEGGAAAPPLKNQGGAISNQGGAKKILQRKKFRERNLNFSVLFQYYKAKI